MSLTWVFGLGALMFVGASQGLKRWRKRRRPQRLLGIRQGGTSPAPQTSISNVAPQRLRAIALIQGMDPRFSWVLFEDFAYSLFTAFHERRGQSTVHEVSPYVAGQAAQALVEGRRDDIRNIVVGSMTVTGAWTEGQDVAIELTFEANYEEVVLRDGQELAQAYFVVERWVLRRSRFAQSRMPERVGIATCPECGGLLTYGQGNVCGYCQTTLTPGQFDWALTAIQQLEREQRGPMLTGDVAEQGTHLPTIEAPGARQRFQALTASDANVTWASFASRIAAVFATMQSAWTQRQWKLARPYLTDQLFQMQRYWIDEYLRQGLTNHTDGARIVDIQLANVESSDPFFDAITVRIFATGLDYTTRDADGVLVSGSRTQARDYTEYWTFIRGRGVVGRPRSEPECPHCGGPLAVGMAGECEHCHVKITRGEFDWVLSRIEQDEAYRG